MRFGKNELKSFKTAISREYLITNGIGGYSSSTICGANIRKYSALLVAAINPPVDRRVLLSKLDETVFLGDEKYSIYSNEKVDGVVENGYINEVSFENKYFPVQNFVVNGAFISKKITMKYGENTTIVNYTIINNDKPFKMRVEPLVNNRDHHGNTKCYEFNCSQAYDKLSTVISFDINDLRLNLKSDKAVYIKCEKWYQDMFYVNEK